MKPGSLSAAILLAFFAQIALAEAAPASDHLRARLAWRKGEGGEGCLSGDALRTAVNQRWGREVIVPEGATDLVLEGRVGPLRPGVWGARLEMKRADGTSLGSRELESPALECSALDDSIALAAGLMLDVSRQRIEAEQQARPEEAAPILQGPAIRIPKDTLAPRAPWHVEPRFGGEASVGFLPGVALGLRAGIALEPPRFWRFELGATLWAHSEATERGRGARFSAWTVDLGICPAEWRVSGVRLVGCATQRAGIVRAEGVGLPEKTRSDETLYALGARGAATWEFTSPLALELGARVEVPLVRYGFVYEDAVRNTRDVHRMAPVSGGVDLVFTARF